MVFFLKKTRVRIFIFFVAPRFFFLEFNIRLYDKNSEADYFFFLHQNQNIFSATLGKVPIVKVTTTRLTRRVSLVELVQDSSVVYKCR
jgi:hypothetical protein